MAASLASFKSWYPGRERVFLLNKYQCDANSDSHHPTKTDLPTYLQPVVHMSTFRHSDSSVVCLKCEKILPTSSAIGASFVPRQTVYYCYACSKAFARRSTFRSHLAKHVNFRCPRCRVKKVSNKLMRFHLLQHQNVKPFKCGVCQKGFVRFSA